MVKKLVFITIEQARNGHRFVNTSSAQGLRLCVCVWNLVVGMPALMRAYACETSFVVQGGC